MFDYDALRAAHRTASLILNAKGQLMDVSLSHLICKKGSTVDFDAEEILGALRKNQIARSFDNDGAGVGAFEKLVNPYLSNAAYYWMFDKSMMGPDMGLQFKESQPVQFEGPDVVFETSEIRYKCGTMYDLGFNDGRNIAGSKGTNAA